MISNRYLTIPYKDFNEYSRYMNFLPNPDKIFRKTGSSYEAYRDLKNDAHLWSCIQSRKSGVLHLDYTINSEDMTIEDELKKLFENFDLQQLIRDILEAPLFGFQVIEIIWKYDSNIKKLMPDRFIARAQENFVFDSFGEIKFKGRLENDNRLPEKKFLVSRYESSSLNPYGESLLSKCYWPVIFKKGGIRFWVRFIEKFGMPLLTGQFKRGATFDESQKLANDLANMTQDSVIIAPTDVEIMMHEAKSNNSAELYRDLVKHCNAEISKALLSQTLTTELEMGSYAASKTHFRIRREVILSDIRIVENTINELIKYIVDLNFKLDTYPKFKIILNDSEDYQKLERDVQLSQLANFNLSKTYWMKTYGFEEDDIEE